MMCPLHSTNNVPVKPAHMPVPHCQVVCVRRLSIIGGDSLAKPRLFPPLREHSRRGGNPCFAVCHPHSIRSVDLHTGCRYFRGVMAVSMGIPSHWCTRWSLLILATDVRAQQLTCVGEGICTAFPSHGTCAASMTWRRHVCQALHCELSPGHLSSAVRSVLCGLEH
jgi:hypothetical protein